jgi:hypothetical protein
LEVLKQKRKRAIMVPLLSPQLLPDGWCTLGMGHIILRHHTIPRYHLSSMINHLVKNHEKNSHVYGGRAYYYVEFCLCKRVTDIMKKVKILLVLLCRRRGGIPETKHS